MPPSDPAYSAARRRALLVRHGATEWSKSGQHTGRTDLPLIAEGEERARTLGPKISTIVSGLGERPGLVLASPLRRALDTCRLAGFGGSVEVDENLMEWDYGEYEGRTSEEIHADNTEWDLFRDGCPGGEQLGEVAKRASTVIDRIRRDAREGIALVFAHGHVLRVLAAVWADLDPDAARALPLETSRIGLLGWSHEDPALEGWNL